MGKGVYGRSFANTDAEECGWYPPPPRPMQMFWACQEVRGEGGSQES